MTLELKQYNRFFGESYFTGFVSVDGSRYEDLHGYAGVEGNPFVPAELKENLGGNQLRLYEDYLTVESADGALTVWQHRAAEDAGDRIFSIPLN